MKNQTFALLVLAGFLLAGNNPLAAQPSLRNPLPNFDRRMEQTNPPPPDLRSAAVDRLRARLSQVQVEFDPVSHAPKFISASGQFLTGPHGQGKAVSAAAASGFPAADPYRVTKAFLQEHRELFGHGPDALDKARVKREFTTPHNGLKTVVWEQQVDGIPLFESVLISHTTRNDELVNISSQFLPDPDAAADLGMTNRATAIATPMVSARQAVAIAAQNIGLNLDERAVAPETNAAAAGPEKRQLFSAPGFKGKAETKLVWLPVSADRLRLCWDVTVMSRARGEMFRVLVDTQTGEPLLRRCLTDYLTDASYRVYTSDSPSPFSPSWPTPNTGQPPYTNRVLVTLSALDTNASPAGWINDNGNETLGNNVDAHTDWNADNVADLPRPHGSPARVFDFAMDLSQAPMTYSNAAVVQLFYWNNFMHDKLYELGFTEAAGNFQSNNFGRGGLGNDAVQADAQDGSGYNNANFSTPSDGSPGRMQMYLFNYPTPYRDGDLDAEVVLHEYTHGLSNRRVGGGVGISALQSAGMGEGWSDFYAMALLSEPGDDVNGVYASGGYVTYQLSGLTQNYYFGIRRYPYCTDMSKNPLTFKDIDPAQASAHTGAPRSPIIGTTANEVHNMGEVWCMTLREARANLINQYGWAGNQLILQLVTDGMNLSPANPNFLQARDAILQADLVDTGGANQKLLWAAFAKRGMGYSATSPASSTTTGLVEAYDLPDDLRITPGAGLASTGQVGGPFAPTNQIYWLINGSSNVINWVAWSTQPWIGISATAGSLAVGASNNVNVYLTPGINFSNAGSYAANLVFSNTVSGISQTRAVTVAISPPRVLYFSLDTDPGWSRQSPWAFGQPLGLGGTSHGYHDPTGGATGTNVFGVNLSGDYSISIGGPYYLTAGPFNFAGYTGMKLQFQRWLNADYPPYVYESIQISTNGVSWSSLWTNTTGVAIADTAWTPVAYDISAYADNQTNVFVRWGHQVSSSGAFAYSGWNLDDVAFLGMPNAKLSLTLPVAVTEGSTNVTGSVSAPSVLASDLIVSLASSDASEATVPATVTIPAGQTNAVFTMTVPDDGQLDGTQTATITASAANYAPANASMMIYDAQTAALSIGFPSVINEAQGAVNGTVQISAVPAANVTVNLASSDTLRLQVPAAVTIPAGQTSAVFTATALDDGQIDGTQIATLTAHVQNWTDGVTNVTILDHETLNLAVTLPASAWENAGVLANAGSVAISGTLTTNLAISLASDRTDKLLVPATVTILAGQLSSSFNLTLVDNNLVDGNQSATITASAPGFTNGLASLSVLDDETPVSPFNPAPANFAMNVLQTTNLAWSSSVPPGETITNDVYFGTNPAPGAGEYLGSTTGSSWTLPALAPLTTYYWQIVAHRVGQTAGPVWQFTTRGVDHFAWAPIPSPQVMSLPFDVTVTALDAFNHTVSNFTGSVALSSGGISSSNTLVEDFESGVWPHSPWISVSSSTPGTLSSVYAHDGNYGLSDPEWTYRTDVSFGSGSNTLSWWIRSADGVSGRAYLGFDASASGCWSVVAAPNTSQLLIQQNTAFSFSTIVSVAQAWQGGKWYKVSVQCPVSTTAICNLYDSDGTTLLNSVVCSNVTGIPGGIAMRSFGNWSLDTIALGGNTGGSSANVVIAPTNSGNFLSGVWTGSIAVLQRATNMVLLASDGNGHSGSSNPFDVARTNTPPVILIQPTNQAVFAGGSATFAVAADGTPPLSYQWTLNGNNLPDATNSALTLTGVRTSWAGTYAVIVTNVFGSATSSNALLSVSAHHFVWDMIPSPETATAPFAVTLAAKDAANSTLTDFDGTVPLFCVTTNQTGTNFDFEGGTLAPWTTLNAGNQPGPYGLVTFDVNGDGVSSTAFRIAANSGTPDGITQNVPLLGGMTYSVKLDVATDDSTGGNNADGGQTSISIGGTTVAQFSWGTVYNGNIYRTNLTGTFTPPTNGIYPVTLTFYRAYYEASGLWCLADDLRIAGPGQTITLSPTVSGNFTNGVWHGPMTIFTAGTNELLIADDGQGHTGFSSLFDTTNAMPPVILAQPASQTVLGGTNVVLAVNANGTAPLGYFWQKDGLPFGPTSNTLWLPGVTRTNSGIYHVIISNLSGSVSSSNAVLLVHVPQRLGAPCMQPDGSLLLASSDADGGTLTDKDLANLHAQASSNLVSWIDLPGALTLTNGFIQFHDTGSTNAPQRFYRIIENW